MDRDSGLLGEVHHGRDLVFMAMHGRAGESRPITCRAAYRAAFFRGAREWSDCF